MATFPSRDLESNTDSFPYTHQEFLVEEMQPRDVNPLEEGFPPVVGHPGASIEPSSSSSSASNSALYTALESLHTSPTDSSTSTFSETTHSSPHNIISLSQAVKFDRIKLRAMCSETSSLSLMHRKLLAWILDADYYKYHLPEPRLGTEEGDAILQHLEKANGIQFPHHRIRRGSPLSSLLTDSARHQCLLCDSIKTTSQRAVECVGSHLDYRPFWCGGYTAGCFTCRRGQE
jgi:hypothetical protein